MSQIKTFRDLIAWQKSMELTMLVYRDTRSMPEEEKYGLTAQMRRAAVSIPSNIAEGYGRQSRGDYVKHLRIARGSLVELMTQLEIAERLGMVNRARDRLDLTREVDRVLQGLIKSLDNSRS